MKMRKYYKLLRGKLEEHFPYEISMRGEWQEDIPDIQNLGKIYSLCTVFETIIKDVFQQNTKANPIKEEIWDITKRESSQAVWCKESQQGQT